ncbi:hypothetical protein [Streptomyces sp. TR02-1]|uniref:hypothetical protein n=1 Tax=Streptomyces sp. TR02-1 TaxID=3385977 RepID=UPI0039A2F4B4
MTRPTALRPHRRAWPVGAVAVATAGALLLSAAPPALPATTASAAAPQHAAAADRPVSELLAALQKLYREAESASRAYRSTARTLRAQQKRTAELERRRDRVRLRLTAEQQEAGRFARARYRFGAVELSPTVRVLLADDPVQALHHEHTLRREAARRQAAVRRLAGTERHRGAVAAEARKALQREQRLADRKKQQHGVALGRLRRVERLLASLTPDQLVALRRLEQQRAGGGPPLSGPAARARTLGAGGVSPR